FFAPDSRYASDGLRGEQVREFKQMVKALHQAGIEVILDVVYNHTAEGNHLGPTLSFRGIDNAAYYRLVANDRRYYMDYTGCRNTGASSSSWTASATGCPRCTWTGSASTSRRPWPESSTRSTGCRPSST